MKRDSLIGYLLILPTFIVLVGVIVYPLLTAIDMSFHTIILTKPQLGRPLVGLENYSTVIAASTFSNAIQKTIIWTGINLVVQLVLGTAIALLLHEQFFGRSFARGLMLIPWVTPSVVAVLSWTWMYDGSFGIINDILVRLGIIERGVAWLGNTGTAMPAVIVESVWKGTPFVMVMILAALQTVPQELLDAAKVDGAGAWRRFANITLPLIMPTMMIAATLTTIYTFNNFNAIWLMTEGGPLRATETLTILIYNTAFRAFDLGQASAIGVISLIILFGFVVIFGRRYIQSEIDL
jgi:ABC-type sugar transport system permease subunit